MSADFDPVKTAWINILHHGIEATTWNQSDLAVCLRRSFYQAIADINVGWVTQHTEYAIVRAQMVADQAKGRVA